MTPPRKTRLMPAPPERAWAILQALPTPVLATDAEGRIDFANAAVAQTLRRDPPGLIGERVVEVLRLVDDRHQPLDMRHLESRVLTDRMALRVHHVSLLQPDGNELAVSCAAEPLVGPAGTMGGSVWVLHDVREERQLRHHLSIEARHDPLTGLVNRKELENRLERAVAGTARGGGEHALCFLDLDRFKAVNDRHGHAAGDAVLAEIAGLLLQRIRGRDTLARLGGDEFALLLEHCRLDEARRVAEGLVAAVGGQAITWQGEALTLGLSVGIAPISGEQGPRAVLAAADAACYEAKALGRGCVCVAAPGPDSGPLAPSR